MLGHNAPRFPPAATNRYRQALAATMSENILIASGIRPVALLGLISENCQLSTHGLIVQFRVHTLALRIFAIAFGEFGFGFRGS